VSDPALLEQIPLPAPFVSLSFEPRWRSNEEIMVFRLSDGRRGCERIDLRDCESVVYIPDRDARGIFAFLQKKPVLTLDPRKVEAKRRETFGRVQQLLEREGKA
jgi:hypothetical protein